MHLNPFWLVWAEIECMIHAALRKQPINWFELVQQSWQCPNVSTTPIMAMGCQQCLPLSVVQLKGKHFRKPHCLNGVVDTLGQNSQSQHRAVVKLTTMLSCYWLSCLAQTREENTIFIWWANYQGYHLANLLLFFVKDVTHSWALSLGPSFVSEALPIMPMIQYVVIWLDRISWKLY